jgi:protein gp37
MSAISWCDAAFAPWFGCSKVSPAYDHCYNLHHAFAWRLTGTIPPSMSSCRQERRPKDGHHRALRISRVAPRRVSTGHDGQMIANRLSTVVDADQILVLEHSRVVEHGRHHQRRGICRTRP